MNVFFHTRKNSFLRESDPRTKIAGLVFFCALSLIAASVREMGILLAVLLLLFLLGKCADNLKKTAGLFVLTGSMTFVLWLFFYQGTEKISVHGGFRVYAGAFEYAAVMALRFSNMLLAGLLFLSVTSVEDVHGGMIVMGVPYGFAFAVSLSFRLVMVFMANAFAIVEAQKVRGNDVGKGGIFRRMKAYAPLIVPFVLNGIKKAETLTLALESKGFSPKNKPDLSGKYSLTARDKFLLSLMLVIFIAHIHSRFGR